MNSVLRCTWLNFFSYSYSNISDVKNLPRSIWVHGVFRQPLRSYSASWSLVLPSVFFHHAAPAQSWPSSHLPSQQWSRLRTVTIRSFCARHPTRRSTVQNVNTENRHLLGKKMRGPLSLSSLGSTKQLPVIMTPKLALTYMETKMGQSEKRISKLWLIRYHYNLVVAI